MNTGSDNEIRALLTLLDDPDEEVFSLIRQRIIALGPGIIPTLEQAWEQHFDNEAQQRLESLIHEIQFRQVREELEQWRIMPEASLLDGAIIIARFQYPELNRVDLMGKIAAITEDAREMINEGLGPMESVKVLNHVIYDLHGFRGNKKNFHAPQNSYINDVIQTRKGNPLTLSILYSHIARSLGIPVSGVNLPEHFIMAYVDHPAEGEAPPSIPFYINAFNRGAIFTRNEVELFIRQMKIKPEERYFSPCSNEQVIIRMLHNLVAAYDRLGYPEKIRELRDLIGVFS